MSDKIKRTFTLPRTKRRIVLYSIIGFLITTTCLLQILYRPPLCNEDDDYYNNNSTSPNLDGLPDALTKQADHRIPGVTFQNLNTLPPQQPNVLILSMINPSTVPHLANFFKLIRQLSYPNLSLAILVLNPGPTTVHAVRQHVERARFALPVKIYVKTYDDEVMSFVVTPGKETVYELQPLRRAAIARARTFLLQSALTPDNDYTLWLDPLLTSVPSTLIQDLIHVDQDIVVPNTVIQRDGNEWGHDKRNWQETELSTSLADDVPEDFIFMEGKKKEKKMKHCLVSIIFLFMGFFFIFFFFFFFFTKNINIIFRLG